MAAPGPLAPGTVVAAVLLLGLVCTALAFVAFFELIKEVGSTRATFITYVNPAVAVILGVALLGEQFTLGTGIGFVLILAGCWLSTRPTVGPGQPAPAERPARPPRPARGVRTPRRPQPPRGPGSGGGARGRRSATPAEPGPSGRGGFGAFAAGVRITVRSAGTS